MESAFLLSVAMREANLSGAKLGAAFLPDADLGGANLSGAKMKYAQLKNADLSSVNLGGADLERANLTSVKLYKAILNGVNFEPELNTLPIIPLIAQARGLWEVRYIKSPQGLIELREAFKKAGYHQQEREITSSLKRSRTALALREGLVTDRMEALFSIIFLDWTCRYGVMPWRPFILLIWGILLFTPFYIVALVWNKSKSGIWIIWLPDRVLKKAGQEEPVKLNSTPPFRPLPSGKFARFKEMAWRQVRISRIALYFSLLSAFSLGYKELNVGNWISRIQKKEYILRATGWVRTIAGIQSLVCGILLALWAFLYFGSLFE